MPTVRWSRLEADGFVAGPKVRVSRVELTAGVPLTPVVRWSRLEATAGLPATPRVRLTRLELTAVNAPTLAPFAPQTVEPLSDVTLTAAVVPGSATPDAYEWTVESGGPVTIIGTGATVTFLSTAPLPPDSGAVVVGCKASVGGSQSAMQTATITVLPCLRWYWTGSTWAGVRLSTV